VELTDQWLDFFATGKSKGSRLLGHYKVKDMLKAAIQMARHEHEVKLDQSQPSASLGLDGVPKSANRKGTSAASAIADLTVIAINVHVTPGSSDTIKLNAINRKTHLAIEVSEDNLHWLFTWLTNEERAASGFHKVDLAQMVSPDEFTAKKKKVFFSRV